MVPCALARTNQQLRNEVLPVFKHGALVNTMFIHTHVKNLDFRRTIRLLQKIGRARKAISAPLLSCNVDININIKQASAAMGNQQAVRRWRNFCVQPSEARYFTFEYDVRFSGKGISAPEARQVVKMLRSLAYPYMGCPCDLIYEVLLDACDGRDAKRHGGYQATLSAISRERQSGIHLRSLRMTHGGNGDLVKQLKSYFIFRRLVQVFRNTEQRHIMTTTHEAHSKTMTLPIASALNNLPVNSNIPFLQPTNTTCRPSFLDNIPGTARRDISPRRCLDHIHLHYLKRTPYPTLTCANRQLLRESRLEVEECC